MTPGDRDDTGDAAEGDRRRPHAVIAGTGRAGTSFLVRFLAACGLETGDAAYFERARAGHEHHLDADAADLPYVVKDPLLERYCDTVDLTRVRIDALIIPMRDLRDVAASRVLQERADLVGSPFVRGTDTDVAARVPGGVVYSLGVADQERLLAVGFHRLLHWAMTHDLPVHLLDFPRLVEDGDYLVTALSPWLLGHCDAERGRTAFAQTVEPASLRVRAGTAVPDAADALAADLDRAALLARLADVAGQASMVAPLERDRAHLQAELDSVRAGHAALAAAHERSAGEHAATAGAWQAHFDRAREEVDEARAAAARLEARVAAVTVERDALAGGRATLIGERDALTAERDALTAERDGLSAERDGVAAERDALRAELDAPRQRRRRLRPGRPGR